MSLLTEYFSAFRHFQRNARLYLINNALSDVTVGIILVLYNLYLSALGYRADFIGLVLFMGTLGAGIAIFPAGLCIDRYGGKAILIWSSVLIGLAGAGQMLLRQPAPLLISAFLAGIGAAFMLVINAPFLIANSLPTERSVLFSLNIVVALATTVLGELLGGILPIWLRAWPWAMATLPYGWNGLLVSQPLARSYQLALLIAGLIAAPSFIPLFMMSDDRPKPSTAGTDLSYFSVKSVKNVVCNCFFSAKKASHTQHFLQTSLFTMILFQILLGMGAGLFIPYLNIYFVQHLGASSALFGLIDGCANALNALLTLLAPLLALRISRINTLVFTRLLSLPLMLIIGLTNWLPLAAALYPLRQGLMDMSAGILQVFSMEVVAERHRGMANSSYQAAYQAANGLATPIGGLIITRLGYTPVFVLAAILYMAALTLLWERFGHKQA
jgi:MFS family permease